MTDSKVKKRKSVPGKQPSVSESGHKREATRGTAKNASKSTKPSRLSGQASIDLDVASRGSSANPMELDDHEEENEFKASLSNLRQKQKKDSTKPLHSFFKPKTGPMIDLSVPDTMHTDDATHTVDATPPGHTTHPKIPESVSQVDRPVKNGVHKAPAPVSGKFAANQDELRSGWGQDDADFASASWPSAEQQHVGRRDDSLSCRVLDLPKRERRRSPQGSSQISSNKSNGFWTTTCPKGSSTLVKSRPHLADQVITIEDDQDEHSKDPAILGLKDKKLQDNGLNHLWIEKYRPTLASQVMGNQVPSNYLVQWLKVLALGKENGTFAGGPNAQPSSSTDHDQVKSKRSIMTKVVKERKRQPREDDWIVNDELENDPIDEFDESPDTPAAPDPASTNEPSTASLYPSFESRLANSILLQGPHGCGKTTAVYAAAAELGWEVFEVNPGVKRSGLQLGVLVGEVGKNHLVHGGSDLTSSVPRGGVKEVKRKSLLDAFAKGKSKKDGKCRDKGLQGSTSETSIDIDAEEKEHAQVKNSHHVDLTDSPPRKAAQEAPHQRPESTLAPMSEPSRAIRQSLILLEEVDILYEEDQGFWPEVVQLIADSKRPVVMTCTGESMTSC